MRFLFVFYLSTFFLYFSTHQVLISLANACFFHSSFFSRLHISLLFVSTFCCMCVCSTCVKYFDINSKNSLRMGIMKMHVCIHRMWRAIWNGSGERANSGEERFFGLMYRERMGGRHKVRCTNIKSFGISWRKWGSFPRFQPVQQFNKRNGNVWWNGIDFTSWVFCSDLYSLFETCELSNAGYILFCNTWLFEKDET